MNGPAFRQAVGRSLRTAVLLGIGLGAFFYLLMLSSSSFALNAPNIPFFQKPPRAITAFVGGEADFLRPQGWLATGMLHPIVLALETIGAFLITTSTGATELERGTLDLVLSRPVGRRAYLTSKIAAAAVILTVVQIGGLAGVLIARETVRGAGSLEVRHILLAFVGVWILFAGFSMTALWIFSRSSLRARALAVSVGAVVVAFFVNFVSLLFDATTFLGYVTPFHYYRAADIVRDRPYEANLALLAVWTIIMGVLSFRVFARRDLTR